MGLKIPYKIPSDSIISAGDSVVADTVVHEPLQGIVVERTDHPLEAEPRKESVVVDSWLYAGLTLLFCLVCFRFKSNVRYFRAMIRDFANIGNRHNLNQETVREISFLVVLNMLNTCSLGLLLFETVKYFVPSFAEETSHKAMAICLGGMVIYWIFQMLTFYFAGSVFTDSAKAKLCCKAYMSTNSMMAMLLFPASLIGLLHPQYIVGVFIFSAVIFLVGKTLFIMRGASIFMTQEVSWVLFLYYVACVEVVPIIMAVAATLCFSY